MRVWREKKEVKKGEMEENNKKKLKDEQGREKEKN